MSIIRADSIKNRVGNGAPDFPNGITVTGVVTATSLNSVSNNIDVDDFIEVGNNIQLGNAGVITATSGNFTGNVSIGGTLTYEDVTNIDSVGLITARDGVFIPDNKELKIGNTAGSPDLKIYHDTSDSIIQGSVPTVLRSNLLLLKNYDNSKSFIRCTNDNNVEIYYNNSKKLNTEAGGVLISGVCSATSYTGDGSALTGISVGISTEALTTAGNTVTLDLSKDDHKITKSGTYTITCTGGTEASAHTLRIVNSGIATVGFSTYFLFPSGGVPNLPTANGAVSLISFTVHRAGASGISTQLLSGASLNFS